MVFGFRLSWGHPKHSSSMCRLVKHLVCLPLLSFLFPSCILLFLSPFFFFFSSSRLVLWIYLVHWLNPELGQAEFEIRPQARPMRAGVGYRAGTQHMKFWKRKRWFWACIQGVWQNIELKSSTTFLWREFGVEWLGVIVGVWGSFRVCEVDIMPNTRPPDRSYTTLAKCDRPSSLYIFNIVQCLPIIETSGSFFVMYPSYFGLWCELNSFIWLFTSLTKLINTSEWESPY